MKKLEKYIKHIIFAGLMIAIAIRMYFISFKLSEDTIVSILAGILVSLLLWGIGYIKDKKILLWVSVMEILLTLTVFWFEIQNINAQKQKEEATYNETRKQLVEKEYERLIEERKREIQQKTISIPQPYKRNCPSWYDELCENTNSYLKKINDDKYAKEIAFNQSLQMLPFPDKNKIQVYLPKPSKDALQRILISFIFNVSIPIFYYLLGLNLAISGFGSVREEAIHRYKNRTDETVNQICRDLGIPVSTLYHWVKGLEPVGKPLETIGNQLEEVGNDLETIGNSLEDIGNPLEVGWKKLESGWNTIGSRLEAFGKRWKRVGSLWKPVGSDENLHNLTKKDTQDGFS